MGIGRPLGGGKIGHLASLDKKYYELVAQ